MSCNVSAAAPVPLGRILQEHSIRTAFISQGAMASVGPDMWWTVVKEAATNWSSHKDARQGAALAYYSVFSLGPIIVIAIAVASLLFGHEAVTSQVMSSIKEMLGETGAKAVEAMLAGASRPAAGILATVLGPRSLAVRGHRRRRAAEGRAQRSLGGGRVRENRALALRPQLRAVIRRCPGTRLSASGLAPRERRPRRGRQICRHLPAGGCTFTSSAYGVVMVLFAMMFKWLPDVSVDWRDVWLGAFLTALFFEVGKAAIGFYIGK
jgi:membrane protein